MLVSPLPTVRAARNVKRTKTGPHESSRKCIPAVKPDGTDSDATIGYTNIHSHVRYKRAFGVSFFLSFLFRSKQLDCRYAFFLLVEIYCVEATPVGARNVKFSQADENADSAAAACCVYPPTSAVPAPHRHAHAALLRGKCRPGGVYACTPVKYVVLLSNSVYVAPLVCLIGQGIINVTFVSVMLHLIASITQAEGGKQYNRIQLWTTQLIINCVLILNVYFIITEHSKVNWKKVQINCINAQIVWI